MNAYRDSATSIDVTRKQNGKGQQGTNPLAEKEGEFRADIGKVRCSDQRRLGTVTDRRSLASCSRGRSPWAPKNAILTQPHSESGMAFHLLAIRRLKLPRRSTRTQGTGTTCRCRPICRPGSRFVKMRYRCCSSPRPAGNSSLRLPRAWQCSLVGNNMCQQTTAATATATLRAVPRSSRCCRRIESWSRHYRARLELHYFPIYAVSANNASTFSRIVIFLVVSISEITRISPKGGPCQAGNRDVLACKHCHFGSLHAIVRLDVINIGNAETNWLRVTASEEVLTRGCCTRPPIP